MNRSKKNFIKSASILILLVVIFVFFYYGLPRWESSAPSAFHTQELPASVKDISPEKPAPVHGTYEQIKNLPVEEVPTTGASDKKSLALWITGDGGWGSTDSGMSHELAAHGIPVIGLNSLRYFANPQTPESVSNDVANLLYYYLAGWKKEKVVLIGYSFGANVMPFAINRLPEDLRARVDSLVLIGPEHSALFELDIENFGNRKMERQLVLPELTKSASLHPMNIFCFYGTKEKDTICTDPNFPKHSQIIPHSGEHAVKSHYRALLDALLSKIQ